MPRRSKRQDRLCEERNASIKPIPKDCMKLMRDEMDDEHRIYYKKTRSTIEVICSLTGKQDTFYRNEEDPYSGKKTMQQDPAHNDYGKCPICGKYGKFISPGRAKNRDVDTQYYTFYNQWEEDGLVARHIEVRRRYYNQYSDSKGLKIYREEVIEYARTYLKIGQEAQTDFCKVDYCYGREFWDYKNLYGMTNIKVVDESAKELNISLLRKAPWKYALDVYYQINGSRGVNKTKLEFLKRYVQYPEIEIMFKTGMYQLAANLIDGWNIKKYKGKHIWNQYGITKAHWDYIREHDLGIGITKVFQKNDMHGYGYTAEQVQWLYNNIHLELEEMVFELTTPTKLINYIKKQMAADNDYTTENIVYSHYVDYLNAMRTMGYDLTNTVYLFPKNLQAKHDEAVHRLAVQQNERKKQEKNEEFKNIAKNFGKLCKKYAYEEGEFLIRPASSASEIITEGREMHHCVGGDNYLKKHNKGQTYILLMRRRINPEIPFCTVEIKGSRIVQWYEAHDTKKHKKTIQPWLDAYVEHLKEKKHGTNGTELAAG